VNKTTDYATSTEWIRLSFRADRRRSSNPMTTQVNRKHNHSAAETLIACENETWNLIQRKDLQRFARYLADEFYDIFPDGKERN
jgi:hypothetical protein